MVPCVFSSNNSFALFHQKVYAWWAADGSVGFFIFVKICLEFLRDHSKMSSPWKGGREVNKNGGFHCFRFQIRLFSRWQGREGGVEMFIFAVTSFLNGPLPTDFSWSICNFSYTNLIWMRAKTVWNERKCVFIFHLPICGGSKLLTYPW